MSKGLRHYWWEGKNLAFIACGNRADGLRLTTKRSEVTCSSCRKTWRFKNHGVVKR